MKLLEEYLNFLQKPESLKEDFGIISGIVVSSLLIGTAYHLFRKNFKKNAKQCIDVSQAWNTQEKNICILKQEIKFRKQQIIDLLDGKAKCSIKLKDKHKIKSCIEKLEQEVKRLKDKIPDLEKRFRIVKLFGDI